MKPIKLSLAKTHSSAFALEDVIINATSNSRVTILAAGWRVAIHRRTLWKPQSGSPSWYLDVEMGPKTARPSLAHGVIGQSFGGGAHKGNGKLDGYSNSEVTTTAQVCGAHTNVYFLSTNHSDHPLISIHSTHMISLTHLSIHQPPSH